MTSRPSVRVLRSLAALVVLTLLLVGIPAGLLLFGGSPWAARVPGVEDLGSLLASRDTVSVFLLALIWVGWIAWATFALSVLIEVIARLRGTPAPRIPGLGLQQSAAALLLTALLGGAVLTAANGPPVGSASTGSADDGSGAPAAAARVLEAGQPGDSASGAPAAVRTGAPAGGAAVAASSEVPGSATPAAGTATAQAPSSPEATVTVQPGDSLWSLAQRHLGDGKRWTEIAEANYGRPQADGTTLERGDMPYLEPGWVLILPGVPANIGASPAAPSTSPAVAAQIHAQRDRAAHATAADRNRHEAQDHEHEAQRRQLERIARSEGGHGAAASAGRAGQRTATAPATQDAGTKDVPLALSAAPWAGIGSLLAAAVIVARRPRRRTGQDALGQDAHDLPDAEHLAQLADPAASAFLDAALRALAGLQARGGAPMPDVHVALLAASHLELICATPMVLPAPFEMAGDPTRWRLARSSPLVHDAHLTAMPAPYPALVPLGTASDGTTLLVDLEQLRALGIEAPADLAPGTLDALAASLAALPWTAGLSVATIALELAAPAAVATADTVPGRLVHHRSVSEYLARTAEREGREHPATGEVLLVGSAVTPAEREHLHRLAADPSRHLALVEVGGERDGRTPSPWRMSLTSPDVARLEPIGLTLRPQHLTAHEATCVLRVVDPAQAGRPRPRPGGRVPPAPPTPTADEDPTRRRSRPSAVRDDAAARAGVPAAARAGSSDPWVTDP